MQRAIKERALLPIDKRIMIDSVTEESTLLIPSRNHTLRNRYSFACLSESKS